MKHRSEWEELVHLATWDLLQVPTNNHRIAILEANEELLKRGMEDGLPTGEVAEGAE